MIYCREFLNIKMLSCLLIHLVSHRLIKYFSLPNTFFRTKFLLADLLKNYTVSLIIPIEFLIDMALDDLEIDKFKQ